MKIDIRNIHAFYNIQSEHLISSPLQTDIYRLMVHFPGSSHDIPLVLSLLENVFTSLEKAKVF